MLLPEFLQVCVELPRFQIFRSTSAAMISITAMSELEHMASIR